MNDAPVVLEPELPIGYSQFFVYDIALKNPACDWTDAHVCQGFARRRGTIAVGTLVDWGPATVTVHLGLPAHIDGFERVIAVPLEMDSGVLRVDAPEECEFDRGCDVPPGHYRVVAAQRVTEYDEDLEWGREDIHIYLEKLAVPLERSAILVADERLQDPPEPLIETANEPGI